MDQETRTVTRIRSTSSEEVEERKTGGGPSPRRVLRKRSLYTEHSEESSSEEGSIDSDSSDSSESVSAEIIKKRVKRFHNNLNQQSDTI